MQSEGEEFVCLRDPQGFAAGPIFLNKHLAFLVARMNGRNSLRDIQADFMRATGELVPMEQLERLVSQLDDQHFLESTGFDDFYREQARQFLDSPTRRAIHAGSAYEAESEALRNQIRGFFDSPEGPRPNATIGSGLPLRGLIAPHIDFHRGGTAYAHAYSALMTSPAAERFIIFGTCHNPMQRRFALTLKNFETPLGVVETDSDFVRTLAGKLPLDYFSDEFAHRGEHSLEFQSVFLKYAMGEARGFKIIPILVGSFHDIYEDGGTAAENEEIAAVVKAILETASERPARCIVVAGADLAHVGRRFGDAAGPSPASLAGVEREDRRFLELVAAGDAEGMFRSIAADGDRRRVCGYPPIYMMLRCLGSTRGELLRYLKWADLDAGAAVTFAAMALY